jgi:hypothetical protein
MSQPGIVGPFVSGRTTVCLVSAACSPPHVAPSQPEGPRSPPAPLVALRLDQRPPARGDEPSTRMTFRIRAKSSVPQPGNSSRVGSPAGGVAFTDRHRGNWLAVVRCTARSAALFANPESIQRGDGPAGNWGFRSQIPMRLWCRIAPPQSLHVGAVIRLPSLARAPRAAGSRRP